MRIFKSRKEKNDRPTLDVVESAPLRSAARSLLVNIQYSSVDTEVKSVVVSSAVPNEGKTTVALSLAAAVGEVGKRCLIIEADMRRRSLHGVVRAHPQHGVHDVLMGKAALEDAAVPIDMKGVWFLDAEPGIPNPAELLESRRYSELIEEAARAYDFVVFDTPPLGAYPDAAVLSRRVDGTVFVVRLGQTGKREASMAVEQLRATGAHLLGIVPTFQETTGKSGYGYYGYYYEEKHVPIDSPEAQEALGRAAGSE